MKKPIDPTVHFPWWRKWGLILGAVFWGWTMLCIDKAIAFLPRETYDDN